MTYTPFARRVTPRLAVPCFALLLLAPAAVRAAECPASSPEDPQERRKLAKEWFATAENAENAGNDAEATRSYACSYKMVAHPFTAYNLGRVAERAGDSELALKMFKAYLTLKPDAQDAAEVRDKVKALEEKVAAGPTASLPTEPPQTGEGTSEPSEPPPEALTPPPEPKPPVVRIREPEPEPESRSHVAEWVVGGVSVAALVGGLALNLGARSKMSSCQTNATSGQLGTALSDCNAAKPLAYWSYALFGVAAAGAAVDAVLLILHNSEGGSSSHDEASLGFAVLPGGGAVTARGRF